MTLVRHKFYLIDDLVEFYPIEKMLHSKVNDAKVTLLASASECFVCLLENHGSLVTKKELIYTGWEKYDLHVSDSTFNQNIFTLRKALKECGLCHDIIKTVPRKGLVIPETIKVSKVKNNIPLTTDGYITESGDDKENTTPETKNTKKFLYKSTILNLMKGKELMLTYLVCISGVVLGGYLSFPKDYIDGYKTSVTYNNCHLKFDSQRSSLSDFKKFSSSIDFECRNNETVYFSTYQNVPRVSAIRCNNAPLIHTGNTCISWYYLDKKS